jgi:sulfur-carrier protein
VAAGSLRSVLEEIGRDAPALCERLLDEGGGLRRHVNVFVNDEDVRFRELLDTPVREGDRVTIVPAIAWGEPRVTRERIERGSRARAPR